MTPPEIKKIVLAEDDEDDSLFFEDALNSIPNQPVLIRAKDGVELTGLLDDMSPVPDLIFLDINMPRKNGTQCLHEIRRQDELDQVPVIVLSTTNSEAIIEQMYQSGANLYIQKPSDIRMWRRAIAKVLDMDWNIHPPYSVKEQFTLTEF
jgi:CheY-like chemotaxis protein